LLESSPLPIATFDQTGRYLTVNRAWEEFMGRSRDLVVGLRVPEEAEREGLDTVSHGERAYN
jgi:PAS domain S-box-containing protein